MTWFSTLTGITDETSHNVEEQLCIDGAALVSKVNQRRFKVGELTQPCLSSLRLESLPDDALPLSRKLSRMFKTYTNHRRTLGLCFK